MNSHYLILGQNHFFDVIKPTVMDDKKEDEGDKSPIYPFYYNRKDKRILVPKLVGYGYTFNLGHWASWAIIIALIIVPLIVIKLFF